MNQLAAKIPAACECELEREEFDAAAGECLHRGSLDACVVGDNGHSVNDQRLECEHRQNRYAPPEGSP
jgi:hypothetical protein